MTAAIRPLVLWLLCASVTACSAGPSPPQIDQIEMRLSGWTALDIAVTSQGQGRYHRSHPSPNGLDGTFSITPQQFVQLRERLAPFRQLGEPFSQESSQRFIEAGCPPGVPFVTDAGALYVRWRGPQTDQHYLADLGCDSTRNASRNRELLGIIASLPIPPEPRASH